MAQVVNNVVVFPMQTVVRESCKAANIWETAPLLKNISPASSKKFYDTVRGETVKLHMTVWTEIVHSYVVCILGIYLVSAAMLLQATGQH